MCGGHGINGLLLAGLRHERQSGQDHTQVVHQVDQWNGFFRRFHWTKVDFHHKLQHALCQFSNDAETHEGSRRTGQLKELVGPKRSRLVLLQSSHLFRKHGLDPLNSCLTFVFLGDVQPHLPVVFPGRQEQLLLRHAERRERRERRRRPRRRLRRRRPAGVQLLQGRRGRTGQDLQRLVVVISSAFAEVVPGPLHGILEIAISEVGVISEATVQANGVGEEHNARAACCEDDQTEIWRRHTVGPTDLCGNLHQWRREQIKFQAAHEGNHRLS
mmetsp:Transcript_63182/g.100296  ORF Transcript_63182/g.100296 Transcript_63182/m.100296 type:complete len:272 (+) Transcript_63182:2069-2884(+)